MICLHVLIVLIVKSHHKRAIPPTAADFITVEIKHLIEKSN